jgi:hypothetical protein
MVPMSTTLRSRGTIPMLDSMVNAWNILDHETTPRERTLLDEICHSNMTHVAPLQRCPGCRDSPLGTPAATDLRLRCAEMPTGAKAALRLARQTVGRPVAHGLVGDGRGGKVCGAAFSRAGVGQAKASVAEREGDCAVSGPSTLGRPKMAKMPSTALLSAHCLKGASSRQRIHYT